MMYEFLANNRDELIARCRQKVSLRPGRAATAGQLFNGVPIFLDQLIRTLALEQADQPGKGTDISGPAGGALAFSEVRTYAELHAKDLLEMDFTVDQVVHDYGDLCQAVTDLAIERDAPFEIEEYRTLNRCLDNAIANAVSEFSYQRDFALSERHAADANERIAHLSHELRDLLSTASLAFAAAKVGGLNLNGATGAILERSLAGLARLIDHALDDDRLQAAGTAALAAFPLAGLIEEAVRATRPGGGATLVALPVDPGLALIGNRPALLGVLCHLLASAARYTRPATEVTLTAYSAGERILIDVRDCCGGIAPAALAAMFRPHDAARPAPGRGGWSMALARQAVRADAGELSVLDTPGAGCVFSINLPRHEVLT